MNSKYVLLLGGYGYGNVGDEAQLSQNIKLWREYVPDFEIIVLSPYPEYTAKTHQCKSDYASREVFFDQDKKSYFWRENLKFKLIYFYTYFKLTINCYLKRIFSFYFFLTKEESHFLNTLINAQYVHFCGGGYLTGKTKSRLWDGLMIMHLCRILKITYFLTGQTIGLFEGKVENFLCKRGFFGAKKISLRDPVKSKNELLNLGVMCELIGLGDDAIFSSNQLQRKSCKLYET
jgi:polysaccharide pyruvyl transferase WcaK-like protein